MNRRRAVLAAMAAVVLHAVTCLVAMAYSEREMIGLFAIAATFILALALMAQYYREEWKS